MRWTIFTTNAPFKGRVRDRAVGKRYVAARLVVYPEFQTRKTSSPIRGIQWKRRLKSARCASLLYCTKPKKFVRVLKSYSIRPEASRAMNLRAGHEVAVTRGLPDPGASHEAQGRCEPRVDAVQRHEIVEQVVGVVRRNA